MERLDDDGAKQDHANFNVVHIKPNGGNTDAIKYLKNYSDEIVDVPTVASVLEEQTDVSNEGPKKKHRKHRKKKKKHKKRDHEQKGIEFSKDEHDYAAVHGI
ncbi:hypothetical protein ACJMK2_012228 [Sinanodonta woodiana]|uniref:Uncharacterized protein n=1 Tax=Sinanodonta woodiana TaxID=1069815 RepID=A0ABD3V7K1_SINWO